MAAVQTKNNIVERPPIVVVLGHVDHGKSTLLDYIRKSNTVEKEAGGITQHVAAYEVEYEKKKKITFLDTPGHEAFQSMRSRSTSVADIAVLIVSAEDGVQAQTKEALKTIQEQNIPFVVAINKTDLPAANVEKTIASLTEHEVYLEGRGGAIPYTTISAKTGAGVNDLLELILLVAEVEELRGDPNKTAEGFVIESHRDPKKGVSATLLITNGTLTQGMYVATEHSISPTRIMEDFAGNVIRTATFSSPVRVVGWNTPPTIGALFASFDTKKVAEAYIQPLPKTVRETKKDIEAEETEKMYVPIIIKTDVVGSIDAIKHEIEKIKGDTVDIKILSADTGAISENDIKTAGGDNRTIVVGFNTRVEHGVQELAERDGITVATFTIIYELAEWLSKILEDRKPSETHEQILGTVTILKLFSETKKAHVVGGRVESGRIAVGDRVTIQRRDEEIGTGIIKELQSGKQSSREVSEGNECGIKIETAITVAPKDILQAKAA